MEGRFRVNPETLTSAANEISNHGETLHALHQSCHNTAVEAHAGWVGSSAGALSGLLDGWEATSTAHLQRVGAQSSDMRAATAEFYFMEQRHRQAFDDVDVTARRRRDRAL
ncbi:MAG TPA: WXG100 family type VII secretion target [Mycobacterium sp.]